MGKKINTLVLLTLAMCVCTPQIAVGSGAFLDKIINKFVRIRWIAELPVTERVLVPVKIKRKDNTTRWMLRALHVPNKNDKSTWFVVRRAQQDHIIESLFAGRRFLRHSFGDNAFLIQPEHSMGITTSPYRWVMYPRGADVKNAGVWLGLATFSVSSRYLQIPPGNPTGLGAYLADVKGSRNIRSAFVIELVNTTEVPPPAVRLASLLPDPRGGR